MRLTDWLITPGQLQKVGRTSNHQPPISGFPVSTSAISLQRPRELHFSLLVPAFRPDAVAAGLVLEQGGPFLLPPPALLLQDAPLVLPSAPVISLLMIPVAVSAVFTSFFLRLIPIISIKSLHALRFFTRVVASDYLLHSPDLQFVQN